MRPKRRIGGTCAFAPGKLLKVLDWDILWTWWDEANQVTSVCQLRNGMEEDPFVRQNKILEIGKNLENAKYIGE